ncbi:N4-gp56 family major capsid protein [Vibrio plantisponsor]|uniref:N4-gp56 family major capsid protein n=1 Tax=Vibrio plantisponsor TaxID=664643 RepID=UPI00370BA871
MSTTYGDISPRVGLYAKAQFLVHAEPVLVLSKLGTTEPVPKKRGTKAKFRRAVPWAPATVPLTEGVRPSAQKLTVVDVEVDLKQYGAWTGLTDVIADTHEDPVLQTMMQLSGEQAAETAEIVLWGILSAGTAVVYTNGAARNEVNTPISLVKLRQAVRTLSGNRAKKKTRILSGSSNYATQPVEAAYIAVCHTDLEADIRDLAGFTPVAKYGSRSPIVPEEFGSVENVRFITTALLSPFADAGAASATMVSTSGTNADVYPILVFGTDAYGVCPLKGHQSHDLKVRNPGKAEHGDELGQNGSVGWIMWFAGVILNQAWLQRIEAAATQL